jgi:hypothetical protein
MRMNESNDKNFDDELMATAARLGTDVKPERDLWPGIEQAISQPARPSRTVWNSVWAQAAAVLLLVGGSSGVTYLALLTPEERAEVQKNMDLIRTAIEDINEALAAEPDNELLQKMLLDTYREELNLMMRVDNITGAAMRRGDI